jgi:hypothetical protein
MIALSTRPISGVQVTVGLPSNGGVLNVSSSIATTTAGEGIACGAPKMRHRSVVSASIENPRNPSSAGDAPMRPAVSAIRTNIAAARGRSGPMGA